MQIRRVRYPVKKATQAILARKVPGAPLLIHKLVEARYRNHDELLAAARRHSGLPPRHPHVPPRRDEPRAAAGAEEPLVASAAAPEVQEGDG